MFQFLGNNAPIIQDCDNIIFGKAYNNYFYVKIELIEYNAALILTETDTCTSPENIYPKLSKSGVLAMSQRWFRKLSFFKKFEKWISISSAYIATWNNQIKGAFFGKQKLILFKYFYISNNRVEKFKLWNSQ